MFQGLGANLVGVTPEKAIKLAANEYLREKLGEDEGPLPLHYEMLAGAGAGFVQCIATNPMEITKIRLQVVPLTHLRSVSSALLFELPIPMLAFHPPHSGVTCMLHISRGYRVLRQLGGVSLVVVIVALFLPTVCPVGGGTWGIFGKPLERAIWNTLGLHAVLTICLRCSSVLDGTCASH